MNEDVRILCVDDEKNVLKALNRLFMDEEYEVLLANSGEEGLETLAAEESVQVIISDYRMPGMNGVDFLKQVYERWPDTVRIVLSGYADTAAVVAAINEGQIYKFIPKPWNDDELKVTIAKAVEVYFLRKRNNELTRELSDYNEELKRLNENLEELVDERTEELLFQNKVLERAQKILDALPVGVLGLDTQGMIVQCNARAHYFFQGEGAVVP
ncbi:MAG: response regulator, partial [Proteobacteria bacterium]|nr:response regulator [Pseudomonadota bacterium]